MLQGAAPGDAPAAKSTMAEKTKQENRVCFSVLKNVLVFGALRENGLFSRALVLSVPVTAGATRSCGLADALAHLSLAFVVNNQWLKEMGLSTRSASKN